MSSALRKFALAVHLTVSVGWLGAIAAYLSLDLATVTSQNPQILRAVYVGMESIARDAIIPLATASLFSGILISLGTKWGLFRHYWVVVSLILTTIATLILFSEASVIASLSRAAVDPDTSVAELRSLPSTLAHSIGGALVLLVVLFLNIYKPQGLTRYGWRKQQETQKRAEPGQRNDFT